MTQSRRRTLLGTVFGRSIINSPDAATARTRLGAQASGTYAPLDSTPTIDELAVNTGLFGATLASSNTYSNFVAPFGLSIVAFSLTVGTAIAASDTDYWTVNLRKFVNGSSAGTIASKTTQVTGGEALGANKDWNFDSITFDAGFKVFNKGDVLNIQFVKAASAATLDRPQGTFRYRPT